MFANVCEMQDTAGMFANVQTSMQRRYEACITCGGHQFQHFPVVMRCISFCYFYFYVYEHRIINNFFLLFSVLSLGYIYKCEVKLRKKPARNTSTRSLSMPCTASTRRFRLGIPMRFRVDLWGCCCFFIIT